MKGGGQNVHVGVEANPLVRAGKVLRGRLCHCAPAHLQKDEEIGRDEGATRDGMRSSVLEAIASRDGGVQGKIDRSSGKQFNQSKKFKRPNAERRYRDVVFMRSRNKLRSSCSKLSSSSTLVKGG